MQGLLPQLLLRKLRQIQEQVSSKCHHSAPQSSISRVQKELPVTKESRPPGQEMDLDVTLDKTGKKAMKTNVVHSKVFGVPCTVL